MPDNFYHIFLNNNIRPEPLLLLCIFVPEFVVWNVVQFRAFVTKTATTYWPMLNCYVWHFHAVYSHYHKLSMLKTASSGYTTIVIWSEVLNGWKNHLYSGSSLVNFNQLAIGLTNS